MRVPNDFKDLKDVELGVEFKSADFGDLSVSRKVSDIPFTKPLFNEFMRTVWQLTNNKDFSGAVAAYDAATKDFSKNPGFLNGYAWFLVTVEDNASRNPKKAITLAAKAVKLTKGLNGHILDTLAVAYYEDGQLKKAVETMEKAVPLCPGLQDVATRAAKYKRELEEK